MARIYLDANVFISYAKQEIGWNVRGLFIEASQFLSKIRANNDVLVLSELFFDEVKRKSYLDTESVLAELDNIPASYETYFPAEKPFIREIEARGIHRPDSIHVGLAIQAKCDYIVTFNTRDFMPAEEWIKVIQPSDY